MLETRERQSPDGRFVRRQSGDWRSRAGLARRSCRAPPAQSTLAVETSRRCGMARIVRCGLIQAHCEWSPTKTSLPQIKENMIAKHEKLIAAAAKRKVQILGLQELFYGPYFCAEQQQKWYELTERVPDGPTVTRMQKLAKTYSMAMIVP